MESGNQVDTGVNATKGTMSLIRNQATEYILGTTDGHIEELLKTIAGTAMANFSIVITLCVIEETGSTENDRKVNQFP